MSQTIEIMLLIARVESSELEMKPSQITMRTFMKKMLREAKEGVGGQASLTLECPASLSLHTDPKLLQEIMSNLLSNALKYTPKEGGIVVRVKKRKDSVIIEVQDSGFGIPKHQQTRIFQKFFRGSNIVDKDTEGTGLGLYLVFLITNLLGGSISFVSREKKRKGTTFTLTLPAA